MTKAKESETEYEYTQKFSVNTDDYELIQKISQIVLEALDGMEAKFKFETTA